MKLVIPGAVICLALVGHSAYASTVPISSSLNLVANADTPFGVGIPTSSETQSQGATINPLSVLVGAISISFDSSSAQAFGSGSATWSTASAGAVNFDDIGWVTENVTSGSVDVNQGTGWRYTFLATASGTFHLAWNITTDHPPTTDSFGLNGFFFDLDGTDFLALDTSGTMTRALIAGNTYTVSLNNQANLSGNLGTRAASMDGDFDWHIDYDDEVAAVPEPATLLLLGSGLFVAARRRRRT